MSSMETNEHPIYLHPILQLEIENMMKFCNMLVDFNFLIVRDHDNIRYNPSLQLLASQKITELLETSQQLLASLNKTKIDMEVDHHNTTNRLVMTIVNKAYEAQRDGTTLDENIIDMFKHNEKWYQVNHSHCLDLICIQVENLRSIEQIIPHMVLSYNLLIPTQNVSQAMSMTCTRCIQRSNYQTSNNTWRCNVYSFLKKLFNLFFITKSNQTHKDDKILWMVWWIDNLLTISRLHSQWFWSYFVILFLFPFFTPDCFALRIL